jgi:hypothetical protein
MMDALEVLTKQTDEKVSQIKDYLSEGKAESFEEYKRLCGEIRGLLTARGYILDLQQNLENVDDD